MLGAVAAGKFDSVIAAMSAMDAPGEEKGILWIWIWSHAEYDHFIKRR